MRPPDSPNGGGNGSVSGPDGSGEFIQLTGVSTPAFEGPWLMVSAEQEGRLVGVRVDTQVVWLPVRTAAETLPTAGASATLESTEWGAVVSSTSAMPVGAGGVESTGRRSSTGCRPGQTPSTVARTSRGWQPSHLPPPQSTVVSVSVCDLGVSVGGVDQPELADETGAFTNAVEQLLGLPVDSRSPPLRRKRRGQQLARADALRSVSPRSPCSAAHRTALCFANSQQTCSVVNVRQTCSVVNVRQTCSVVNVRQSKAIREEPAGPPRTGPTN